MGAGQQLEGHLAAIRGGSRQDAGVVGSSATPLHATRCLRTRFEGEHVAGAGHGRLSNRIVPWPNRSGAATPHVQKGNSDMASVRTCDLWLALGLALIITSRPHADSSSGPRFDRPKSRVATRYPQPMLVGGVGPAKLSACGPLVGSGPRCDAPLRCGSSVPSYQAQEIADGFHWRRGAARSWSDPASGFSIRDRSDRVGHGLSNLALQRPAIGLDLEATSRSRGPLPRLLFSCAGARRERALWPYAASGPRASNQRELLASWRTSKVRS